MKEKSRARERGGGPGRPDPAAPRPPWWSPAEEPTLDELARNLAATALHALVHRDAVAFQTATVRLLAAPRGVAGWHRAVERVLTEYLQTAVTTVWRQGWQPADLVRMVRRGLGGQHVDVVRDAVAAELSGYAAATIDPRWAPQLAELEIDVWWPPDLTYLRARCEQKAAEWDDLVRLALEVLSLLATLPDLQHLGPIPGAARPGATSQQRRGTTADDRILSRVRGLLAKAESTTFEAEAETLTAGAQALMARHSIDLALLAATSPGQGSPQDPAARRIGIDNPYEGPKTMLLGAVAQANRCRTAWSKHLGFSTVVGFPSDLDAVEMLFTSLLVQAITTMTHAGTRTDAAGRSRTRAFRQSFLTAYAARIGERLREATGAETAAAAAEPGGRNVLPVLAARDEAVQEKLAALFPELTYRRLGSVTDLEGWNTGRSAADLAVLQTGSALPE